MEPCSVVAFRRHPSAQRPPLRWRTLALAVGMVSAAGVPEVAARPSHATEHPRPAQQTTALVLSHAQIVSYPFEQVWPTAIRYLRVDRGFAVVDKDAEAGYLLFEFALDGAQRGHGSLEAFRTKDSSGRPSVRVQVSTSQGPVHLPHAILEGLAAKLLAERGQPAPPPPAKPPGDQPEPPPPSDEDPPGQDES